MSQSGQQCTAVLCGVCRGTVHGVTRIGNCPWHRDVLLLWCTGFQVDAGERVSVRGCLCVTTPLCPDWEMKKQGVRTKACSAFRAQTKRARCIAGWPPRAFSLLRGHFGSACSEGTKKGAQRRSPEHWAVNSAHRSGGDPVWRLLHGDANARYEANRSWASGSTSWNY